YEKATQSHPRCSVTLDRDCLRRGCEHFHTKPEQEKRRRGEDRAEEHRMQSGSVTSIRPGEAQGDTNQRTADSPRCRRITALDHVVTGADAEKAEDKRCGA